MKPGSKIKVEAELEIIDSDVDTKFFGGPTAIVPGERNRRITYCTVHIDLSHLEGEIPDMDEGYTAELDEDEKASMKDSKIEVPVVLFGNKIIGSCGPINDRLPPSTRGYGWNG